MSRRRPSLAAALAALLLSAALAAVAVAVPRDGGSEKQLEASVLYLQRMQHADGGFGLEGDKESDPGVSAWVAYALAAYSVNPSDQARPGGIDAYTYLARHTAGYTATTDWERMLLVAVAACTPARDFGGLDLVAKILARRLPDGSFTHGEGGAGSGVNDTAFAVLAFSLLDDPAARAVIGTAVDYLESVQSDDGSWGYSPNPVSKSVDMTGAVIEALVAGGRAGTEAQRKGFEYIRGLQRADGGFPQFASEPVSNVASTAWAVQAMWAAGIDPRSWELGGRDPLDYLSDRQQPDGSIQYQAGVNSNNLWMTAQVAPAFAGQPLPIPCVPAKVKPEDPPPAASATPSGPPASSDGQGGLGAEPSAGVIAGGGGDGAPLFSGPQPQSRGRTPRGARQIDPKRARKPQERKPRTAAPAAGATPVPITVQPAATATPSRTPTPAPSGPGGAGHGLAGGTGDGNGGDGLPYVTGTLVSSGVSQDAAAAPGLRGAGAGGTSGDAALVIAIALALAVLFGWSLEVRR